MLLQSDPNCVSTMSCTMYVCKWKGERGGGKVSWNGRVGRENEEGWRKEEERERQR